METQLKKGIIEICVLATLVLGDSYGYKLIQDISAVASISESTLYPILKRLEASNCLRTYSVEYNGRLRKYYQITDTGKNKIEMFLQEWKDVNKVYEYILKNNGVMK
jgi:PadR family transcriptional regulator PadR